MNKKYWITVLLTAVTEDRKSVGEVDVTVEAALEARVGVDEALHLVGVARDDDDELVAVVLHAFEELAMHSPP